MNKHCIEYIYEKKIYYKSNKRTLLLSCRRGHSITKQPNISPKCVSQALFTVSIYTYKNMIVI